MKISKLLFCLLLSIVSSSSLFSQKNNYDEFYENSFSHLEYLRTNHKVADGVILTGWKKVFSEYRLTVVKLNPSGDIQWESTDSSHISEITAGRIFSFIDENFIYCYTTHNLSNSQGKKYLWKIDVRNGQVEWATNFKNEKIGNEYIYDYDSLSFVILRKISSNSYISIINKGDGSINQEKSFGYTGTPLSFATDYDKNIYVGLFNQLIKFNKDNLSQELWTKLYGNTSNLIYGIEKMYVDQFNNFFVMGANNSYPVLFKINTLNGEPIWEQKELNKIDEVEFGEFTSSIENLYVSFNQRYSGGGDGAYFQRAIINKASGDIISETQEKIDPLVPDQNGTLHNDDGAVGIDFTCNNDVYLNGYCNSGGFGPGTWGVLKTDGITGKKTHEFLITSDSTKRDKRGEGYGIFSFRDTVLSVGILEDIGNGNKRVEIPYKVVIDDLDPDIIGRGYIGADLQNRSYLVDAIIRGDTIIYLKQFGGKITIEVHTTNKGQIWEKTIIEDEMVVAGSINEKRNNLWLTYYHKQSVPNSPYFTEIYDKAYYVKYDLKSGYEISKNYLALNSDNIKTIDLEISDNDTCYWFYNIDSITYLSKIGKYINKTIAIDTNVNCHKVNPQLANIKSSKNLILFSGNKGLFKINTINLNIDTVFKYPQGFQVFNQISKGDSIVCSGINKNKKKALVLYNGITGDIIKNISYSDGEIIKSKIYDNKIYSLAYGANEVSIINTPISSSTSFKKMIAIGTQDYNQINTFDYSKIYGFIFGGVNKNYQPHFSFYDLNKTKLYDYSPYSKSDSLNQITFAGFQDSLAWFGGGTYGKKAKNYGFLYNIPCLSIINSTNELISVPEFKIYPNPCSNEFRISDRNHNELNVRIIDIDGRLISQFNHIPGQAINVAHLPNGEYIVYIEQYLNGVPLIISK